MIARPAPRQFDLFAAPPDPASAAPAQSPTIEAHPDDAVIARLVEEKEADWYSVTMGYHPRDPHHAARAAPWNVPSRLFQFPYRFRRRTGEGTHLVVKHLLLRDHPHVAALSARTGFLVVYDAASGTSGSWQHAVDLCTDEHWRTLLALQRFTTPPAIAHAVAFAVRYATLTLADARTVLATIESTEPRDRSMSVLASVRRDEHKNEKGVVVRPINLHPPLRAELPLGWEAWLLVHGREDGVFVFRGDHLEWNPKFGRLQSGI